MKLYYMATQDCSGKVQWLLHELNQPFERVQLNYKNGDLKTEEYLKLHPLGQVPVLVDEDTKLFESTAILQYLADKYPEKAFGSSLMTAKQKAEFYQWFSFCGYSADDFFAKYNRLPRMSEEYRQDWGEYIIRKNNLLLQTLEKRLSDQEYMLGNFSIIDICLGYALDSIIDSDLVANYPAVKSYYQRLSQREACLKSEIFKRN